MILLLRNKNHIKRILAAVTINYYKLHIKIIPQKFQYPKTLVCLALEAEGPDAQS